MMHHNNDNTHFLQQVITLCNANTDPNLLSSKIHQAMERLNEEGKALWLAAAFIALQQVVTHTNASLFSLYSSLEKLSQLNLTLLSHAGQVAYHALVINCISKILNHEHIYSVETLSARELCDVRKSFSAPRVKIPSGEFIAKLFKHFSQHTTKLFSKDQEKLSVFLGLHSNISPETQRSQISPEEQQFNQSREAFKQRHIVSNQRINITNVQNLERHYSKGNY